MASERIIAIDFETANEQRGSACSVGLAWVEGGKVARIEERYIRPHDLRFSRFNIAIHGIHPEDVADAPLFPQAMAEFADEFSGATLIAHNAAFDMSVLRAGFAQYGQAWPELDYLCTLQMARRVWRDLGSYKLSAVADFLGLKFQHHNAAEDAAMCAQVALAIAADLGEAKIRGIAKHIAMRPGRLFAGGYQSCSCC
jgi:DNA polymerase III subunit epsilon